MNSPSDLDDQDQTASLDAPSPETGELGFRDGYDRNHLTITIGFGATAFDRLGVTDQRPGDLPTPIDWAKLKEAPALSAENGDIVVQACSDDVYGGKRPRRRASRRPGADRRPHAADRG